MGMKAKELIEYRVEDASAITARTMSRQQTIAQERHRSRASSAMSADGLTERQAGKICGGSSAVNT